jgi:hypothetical protein
MKRKSGSGEVGRPAWAGLDAARPRNGSAWESVLLTLAAVETLAGLSLLAGVFVEGR